jgi:hypothetical protein
MDGRRSGRWLRHPIPCDHENLADCEVDFQFDLGLELIITGLEVRLEGRIQA